MIARIKSQLNNPIINAIAKLVTGTAVGQLIMIAAIPVLTRLYSPENFGELGYFLSAAGIISAIMCGRFELAVFAAKSSKERIYTVKAGLLIGLVLAILLQASFWVASPYLATYLEQQLLAAITYSPIAGLFLAYFLLLSNYLSREKLFATVAKAKVIRSLAIVTMQFILFAVTKSGLLLGEISGRLVALAPLSYKNLSKLTKSWRWSGILIVLKRHNRFLKISTPTALINVLVLQSPMLLLGALYGLEVAGFYLIAQRLIATPMALLGTSVSQVMSSEISTYWDKDKKRCLELFSKGSKKLLLFSVAPITIAAILAPVVFPILLGNEWKLSGYFVSALSLMFVGQFVVTPFVNIISIAQRQELALYWDISRLILVVGSIYLPFCFEESVLFAVTCYSIVMALSYLLMHNILRSILRL